MNYTELKVELVRKGYTIPSAAKAISISKKALYAKMRGESSFTQPEIVALSKVLKLSNERIFEIFFA